MITTEKNTVNIYACGGLGGNLLKKLETTAEMANIKRCFIDTSLSNLRNAKVDEAELFLFEGLDGSGKHRAENHEIIGKHSRSILAKFPPSKFNIVISSCSGGSGSVIGSTLVSQMQDKDTLMSFDSIAHREKTPIVTHYLENSAVSGRSVIDDAALAAIKALLVLFSGNNDELDTADLRHWLTHKDLKNELVSLHFAQSEEGYRESGAVVTVATLAHQDQVTLLTPLPAYQAVGFVTANKDESFIGDSPLHYAISSDLITATHKRLTQTLKEVKDQLGATVAREKLFDKNTEVTEHGLIL